MTTIHVKDKIESDGFPAGDYYITGITIRDVSEIESEIFPNLFLNNIVSAGTLCRWEERGITIIHDE
jgi:hypothetical protein